MQRRGFAISDVFALILAVTLLISIALPAIGHTTETAMAQTSLSNLSVLAQAHDHYATDWNGRQLSIAPDDISLYGFDANDAMDNFSDSHHFYEYPALELGWGVGQNGSMGLYGYFVTGVANNHLIQPIDIDNNPSGFGWFRIPNLKPLHDYVDGRYYSETYYAPADIAYGYAGNLDVVCEFKQIIGTAETVWSSYCLSPAALIRPSVFRAPSMGGFQDPWLSPDGLTVPPRHAAEYSDLKTHMLEHYWLQAPPSDCNPGYRDGLFDDCEPWAFNHGLDSTPATLFYDGHVRLLPNAEVQASDEMAQALSGGVDGLWSRDTFYGIDGYFLDIAFDDDVDVSHHIFTTDGILGRDTLGPLTRSPQRSVTRQPRRSRRHLNWIDPGSVPAPSSTDMLIQVSE